MTEKTVNYTAEMTSEIVEAYTAEPTDATVATLAEKFGKSTKSIVAKLVREKVYVAKTAAAGKRTVTKAELVTQIAGLVGAHEEQLESLEKATLPALTLVFSTLCALKLQVAGAA